MHACDVDARRLKAGATGERKAGKFMTTSALVAMTELKLKLYEG